MTDSVGKARKRRQTISISTDGVEAYKATGIMYFPRARFEGRSYQVILVPNDGVTKATPVVSEE